MLGGIILSKKKEDKHENKKIEIRESGEIKQKGIWQNPFSVGYVSKWKLSNIHTECDPREITLRLQWWHLLLRAVGLMGGKLAMKG